MAAAPVWGQVTKGESPEALKKGEGTVVKVIEPRLTPAQLEAFLKKRTSGGMPGSFDSYVSLLWAVHSIGVWSEGVDGKTPLQSPFPEDYRPTWRELMDCLARQVQCSWRYNHDTGYWDFKPAEVKPPFALKIAEGWTRRDDGQSIVFIPPIAPVGMDVYIMGHYSSDDPAKAEEVLTRARLHAAMLFARNFKPDVSDKDFTMEKVSGETALFFSAPAPRDPKFTWRQWAFVKRGWCFVIVSVISAENEPRLLKEVKGMIGSFEVPE